jgi:hypothetical protein
MAQLAIRKRPFVSKYGSLNCHKTSNYQSIWNEFSRKTDLKNSLLTVQFFLNVNFLIFAYELPD